MEGSPSLVVSSSAARRRARALAWLGRRGGAEPLWVVGARTEAAADLLREAARVRPAALGWRRASLGTLAAALAAPLLAQDGLSALGALSLQALCARLVHRLGAAGALGSLQPVARQPGLPRALARTLAELRLAGAAPAAVERVRPDLGRLLEELERELAAERLADRAAVLARAARALREGPPGPRALLLDVPVAGAREAELVAALRGAAPREEGLLALLPAGDDRSLAALERALGASAERDEADERAEPPARRAVVRVQQQLFAPEGRGLADPGPAVEVLSAPGEGREAVEIARRVVAAARAGVPFDRMAVLLRATASHRAALEEALGRAGVPAWFARGGESPDPAGRAFLALLACAEEGLSAHRFSEYLALGEVPEAGADGAPPPAPAEPAPWVPPDEELLPGAAPLERGRPVEAGDPARTMRAPWRWERLVVEAAVIGGRERWASRLEGLRRELERKQDAVRDEDPTQAERLRRDAGDLEALARFALPLVEALAALREAAPWRDWLARLGALAVRALREPSRVLSLLAELSPLGPVGPVDLPEVRLVLAARLGELPDPPPASRYGRLFVGPAEAARGLAFDVVFVPGLAERLFPQKTNEDPLLGDAARAALGLPGEAERVQGERLALRLAVGAARERLVLSWPRLDAQAARPRVPSFYALEALRAAEGRLPGFAELARRAEQAAAARAGWPAPREAALAIDEAEYDLAVLDGVLRLPAAEARGAARYLMGANPHLARALRAHWLREHDKWTSADGLVAPRPEALAALTRHQLAARAFSATALQRYAACPYQFLLQTVHRLRPREAPEPIDELDPLSRGALLHEVQFLLLGELAAAGLLPLREAALAGAQERLEPLLEEAAARWRDLLCPAIPRVWDDGVAAVRADLRGWLLQLAAEPRWVPWRFELSFGLPDRGARDPHSRTEAVELEGGLRLCGAIDLVERDEAGRLRATDHKSGKAWAQPGTVVAGGAVLQPALYALALERLFPGAAVEGGRLSYCTHAGGFEERAVPLGVAARGSVDAVIRAVGGALREGFFPAAPLVERGRPACERCDYAEVCGPGAARRAARKMVPALDELARLRGLP